MASEILRRIERETGFSGLVEMLGERLTPSDLQSLMLEIARMRARSASEATVMQRAAAPLFAPSAADARVMNAFDRVAFEAAESFDAVDLSPVNPGGTNFLLGGIDPNNVLGALRQSEVLGDSTPALALEAARRRKEDRTTVVRLCASHRTIRLQPFDQPGFTPHFRLFALVSAGRDTGSWGFECEELYRHIRFYLDLFRGLNSAGFTLRSPVVEIADMVQTAKLLKEAGVSADDVRAAVRAHKFGSGERLLAERGIELPSSVPDLPPVKERVTDRLAAEYPEAQFRFTLARLEGFGYYNGWCLRISPETADGERFPVADGGFTDWTARLLQDRKERLLTSGLGSEFVCKRYRNTLEASRV